MAIDPATAAKIAQIAQKLAKDEETRKKVRNLIIGIVVTLLLLISFILYILTTPIGQIAAMFMGIELEMIMDFREDSDFTQILDEADMNEEPDEIFDGSIIEYGSTKVVYYNQGDKRWKNTMYGKSSSIGEAGCGPTSLAIIVSSLTDKTYDPVYMANWAVKNGHRCEGNGSYHSVIPSGAKAFGLKVEGAKAKDAKKIASALANGKLVGVIMGKGHFTKKGHFIVLYGITKDGKILVADPGSRERTKKSWDFNIILNEAKSNASSGGPFWIVSKE